MIGSSLIMVGMISCDHPEGRNTNAVFDMYNKCSVEYQAGLAKEMTKYGMEHLSYWFDAVVEKNGQAYIIVDVQNNSICAKVVLAVNDWNKIEGIRTTGGNGYVGARLKGLKFDIDPNRNKTLFVYRDLEKILD